MVAGDYVVLGGINVFLKVWLRSGIGSSVYYLYFWCFLKCYVLREIIYLKVGDDKTIFFYFISVSSSSRFLKLIIIIIIIILQ